VRAVLQDAIAIVQAEAEMKRIGLTFDFGADKFMVFGDAVRLQQIFWNVLKNAVKFTPEGGKITVETRTLAENGNFAVKIIDTGIGLTIGEIGHIFNAFSQGDHAGTSGSHKFGGLGLARRDYKVMAAASVAEARTLARREKFDLVVSDIGLPDGNGYALMSELRDDFGLKGIALTGYGMEQDVSRGQNAGFIAHLTKPVRIESLEKALGEAF
jgi:CheY-like chemotaxis protein